MIDEIIHKASDMDNDTLHLIDDKLNKIIAGARKKFRTIPENKAEDKTIPKNKAEDKTIPENKAEDKTIPKNKAEDKDSSIPKSKYIYEDMKENS